MQTTIKQTSTSKQSTNAVKGFFSKFAASLGKIGKSLLFPIATLPMAAILLRIGSQIPAGSDFANVTKDIFMLSGNTLFNNLHIIFAVGIAFGLTKDQRGEAALAGFIGITLLTYLMSSQDSFMRGADLVNVFYKNVNIDSASLAVANAEGFHKIFSTTAYDAYDSILANNILNGIIVGSIVSFIYNKFNGAELPSVLGFFSGRRLIPVLTILSVLVFTILWAAIFPWVGYALFKFSNVLASATGNRWANAGIMGVYGMLNRLLLPFGLHHIPNALFWYTLPVFGSDGNPIVDVFQNPISGDINGFLNGAARFNTTGTFQSGFFPVMMFGLPALVAVFYVMADDKEQKKRVLAIFGSAAVVSFLTGITEPIEFGFLFVSPMLFGMHVLLTGLSGFITGLFGIQLGFGFSAGLIDYLLSIPKSLDIIAANRTGIDAVFANPGWIWYIGAMTASAYFFIGKFLVKRFNLNTPGRGTGRLETSNEGASRNIVANDGKLSEKSRDIVRGFGGWENITSYSNCATRLRYDVKDSSKIDQALLKKGGAIGVMVVSKTHVQAIIGPKVELVNEEIKKHIGESLVDETIKAPAEKAAVATGGK